MRLPAYLLLPIGGAVVLVAAVLGAWLWPAPSVAIPSGPPPAVVAPVAVESPPPPPPALPRVAPSRPAQPVPTPPPSPVAMPVVPAPSPVARPSEPPPTTPVPPGVPNYSQITNLPLQQQQQMRNTLSSMNSRASEMAERGAQELARQRDEAHARGDVAEVNRLNGLLDTYRERLERVRQHRFELAQPQAGPPTE